MFGAGTPSATAGQFHFSGVKPKSPVKPSRSRDASLNESAAGDDNEYYEGDEGEHLLFEPVIPLPDKVRRARPLGTGQAGQRGGRLLETNGTLWDSIIPIDFLLKWSLSKVH